MSVRISVVTAFPDLVRTYLGASVLGRGIHAGKLDVSVVDIRDFSEDTSSASSASAYRQIDDYSFGGGGMVIMPAPLEAALESVSKKNDRYVVFPSPQGVAMNQERVEDLRKIAGTKHLVIVCGHYEGLDERFVRSHVDLEVSLGDFVLTGGELPALAIIDAISRFVEGVVGKASAVQNDSFYTGLLDHPHYTRPATYKGTTVPEVLLTGDHAAIVSYRNDEAIARTLTRRPDLLSRAGIMPYLEKGVYVVQLHHPVYDRNGQKSTTAITGMDLHDIARICRTYGVKKYIIVTPLEPQREMIKTIAAHWIEGYGAAFNPDRADAMRRIKTFASFARALAWIEEREHAKPLTVATTAKERPQAVNWLSVKATLLQEKRPAAFLFGTGHGLHEDILTNSEVVLRPIAGGLDGYNHLSVRSAAGIVLDRFFGFR